MSKDDIPEMNFVDMDVDFATLMESADSVKQEYNSGRQIDRACDDDR